MEWTNHGSVRSVRTKSEMAPTFEKRGRPGVANEVTVSTVCSESSLDGVRDDPRCFFENLEGPV